MSATEFNMFISMLLFLITVFAFLYISYVISKLLSGDYND